MITVAVDATPLITGVTGVARYTRELIAALPAAGITPRAIAFGRASVPVPAGIRHIAVPLRVLHALWRVVPLPRVEWLVRDAGILHATGLAPPPSRLPIVVTVHDVAGIERPDLHPARTVADQRALLTAARRAAVVITTTETVARAAIRHGVDPQRVHVAGLGRTPLPPPQEPPNAPAPGFLLAVGALHHRKGFDVLVEALAALDGLPPLVIAGPPGDAEQALRARIARAGLGARVRLPGAVPDAQLAWLYANAAALCMPSRDEGFGLPLIEAFAAGTPVICSDIEALREVAGAHAAFVPRGDPGALAAALNHQVRRGRAPGADARRRRAGAFTWDGVAARTREAYEKALAGSGGGGIPCA